MQLIDEIILVLQLGIGKLEFLAAPEFTLSTEYISQKLIRIR